MFCADGKEYKGRMNLSRINVARIMWWALLALMLAAVVAVIIVRQYYKRQEI
mgnify:CR=1 FL=1